MVRLQPDSVSRLVWLVSMIVDDVTSEAERQGFKPWKDEWMAPWCVPDTSQL